MKYIRRILLGIVILLVLSAGCVFVLITFYKKEMAELLVSTLKTNYGCTLKVEDADVSFLSNWPQASVQLKNIYLASDLYPDKNEPLLKAGSISLSFNLEKLLQKQFIVQSISIKDAHIRLVKDSGGLRNFDFKTAMANSPKDSSASALRFEISRVTIRNTQFDFFNHAKKQHVGIHFMDNTVHLELAQDGLRANVKGSIKVDELLFNARRGAFLKNAVAKTDLDANVYFKSKMIVVYPSSRVTIKKQPYRVNAFVNLKDTSWMMLHLEGERLRYEEVYSLLTPKIQASLDNFAVERPFDAQAMVIAKLNIKEDPILLVDIDVKDNGVKIGNSKIPYSGLSFKGRVLSLDSTRKKGNIEEATIAFTGIRGKIYDYPFTASVQLHNLTDPDIHIKGRLLIEAQKIKYQVAQDFILKGSCVMGLDYSGPVNRLNKNDYLGADMKLRASLLFNNFSYQEQNKPFVYMVKGKAFVNNRDLSFDNLLLKTDAGDATLKGKADGFVNYVLGTSNQLKVDLNAKSDYLDLNPYLPKKEEGKAQEQAVKKEEAPQKPATQQVSASNFEFTAALNVKKLLIRKVKAENASMALSYKNKLLNIKSITAAVCGGKIIAKATVYDMNKINADMEMQDIDINELFNEFENFGQKKIESRHLQGRIFLTANFKTDLDDRMEVRGETMAGEVKLKLKDGHLQNFEPIQGMSNFIFKNRDFNDVTFSELNETFRIKGYEMEIQELEVSSNILNMYVSGVYNFKESSNINVLLPWQNLRKRGKHYIPKSYGESENVKGLKLNFSGPTNNMKISLGHKDVTNK